MLAGRQRTPARPIDVPVWAGHFILPDPPSGVTTQAGDRRVLVLWNRNPYRGDVHRAAGHEPRRPVPAGEPQAGRVRHGHRPRRPAAAHAAAWVPRHRGLGRRRVAHEPPVEGVDVFGPDNGITYWYRVASRDTLDRAGPWSAAVAATPVRSVPPMAPDDLQVSPTTAADGLVVTWRKVTRNVENHQLPDTSQTNYVYRAETREDLEDLAVLSSYLVATLSAEPAGRHHAARVVDRPRPRPRPALRHEAVLLPHPRGRPVRQPQRAVGRHHRHCAGHHAARSDRPGRRHGCADHIRVEWKPEPGARPRRLPDLPWRLRPRLHLPSRASRTRRTRRAGSSRTARAATRAT